MATATPLKVLAGLVTQFQTGDSLPVILGGTGANDAPTALTSLGAAPLASPALTGTPTTPTVIAHDNSNKIASTAYVDGAVSMETTRSEAAEATELARAEAAEALLAPLASPALTGTPTTPTVIAHDNSTKVANTAYVDGAVATETTRAEAAEAAEVTRAEAAEALLAPLASPALTGNPTAPPRSPPIIQLGSPPRPTLMVQSGPRRPGRSRPRPCSPPRRPRLSLEPPRHRRPPL